MSLKEIEDTIARQEVDNHTKNILRDTALVMRLHNLKDSSEVDKQLLIALIQKEVITQ